MWLPNLSLPIPVAVTELLICTLKLTFSQIGSAYLSKKFLIFLFWWSDSHLGTHMPDLFQLFRMSFDYGFDLFI